MKDERYSDMVKTLSIGTEAYSGFINQLRIVAINTKDIEKRKRMRDNMLRIILNAFDASSAYICQHDFDRKISTVCHHFISSRAKNREVESDLRQEYHEDEMGTFLNWLYGDHSLPRVIYIDKLAEDDPERIEYEQYGVSTVLINALYFQDKFWGYLEIWDSRRNRHFNDSEIALVQQLGKYMSDTILTEQG